MNTHTGTVNTLWAGIFVDELARSGLRHVVISPGSRSTPFALAFAAHPDIADISVIDERTAGFVALGIARAENALVAVLCTSGTAAANHLPAVCEAHASAVPLLVLTADRPAQLQDTGAPQTMDQVHLFGRHVRWFHQLAAAETDAASLRYLRATACHACAIARGLPAGPVHVNIPLRPPFEPPAEATRDIEAFGPLATQGRAGRKSWTEYLSTTPPVSGAPALDRIHDAVLCSTRPLVLVGPMPDGAMLAEALAGLQRAGIPVAAEATSQLRGRLPGAIATLDILLRDPAFRSFFSPDLILRLGAAPTTAGLQRLLEDSDAVQIVLQSSLHRADPMHTASMHVTTDTSSFLHALTNRLERMPCVDADKRWLPVLSAADASVRGALDTAVRDESACAAPQAIAAAARFLPPDSCVYLSSSMPVRDFECFSAPLRSNITVLCNRGVNGIDGMAASALGAARARGGPVLLICGDVAFLHDLGSLAEAAAMRSHLIVLLLANGGGAIFDHLPVRDFEPGFTRHFLTPRDTDFRAITLAHGLRHHAPADPSALDDVLCLAWSQRAVHIIEIRSDLETDREQRRRLLTAATSALALQLPDTTDDVATNVRPSLPWYFRPGAPGPAADIPVLFLHGFTRNGASWRPMDALLPERTLLVPDLPGHGSAPAPVHYDPRAISFENTSAALAALLRRLSIERVHLVGYSMGGRVALHFASAHPHVLASLSLISANPGIQDEPTRRARAQDDDTLAARIEAEGLEDFIEMWMRNDRLGSRFRPDDASWRAARHERLQGSAAGLASALSGLSQGRQPDLWPTLATLPFPLCIVAGERDQRYAGIARRIQDAVPSASVHIIPNAAHDVPAEQTEALVTLLRNFWSSV